MAEPKLRPTPWPGTTKKEYRDILTLGAIIHALMAIGLFTGGMVMTIWMAFKWPNGWPGMLACLPLMAGVAVDIALIHAAQQHVEAM